MKRLETTIFLGMILYFLGVGKSLMAQDSEIQTASHPSAQSAPAKPDNFWRRVSLGGYLGLQLGNVTGVVVSPEAQVKIVDQLYGGLGLTYQYYWYKDYLYNTKTQEWLNYTSSVYGGRIFTRYYLRGLFDNFLGNLFAHVEYEYLYTTRPYKEDVNGPITDYYNSGRRFSEGTQVLEINSFFIGGGYAQQVGGKAFVDFLILFNLNDTYNSPYSNPLFRIGFGVGL